MADEQSPIQKRYSSISDIPKAEWDDMCKRYRTESVRRPKMKNIGEVAIWQTWDNIPDQNIPGG